MPSQPLLKSALHNRLMPNQCDVSSHVGNGCMSYLNASKYVHDRENGFVNNMNKQEADVSE